MPPISVTGALHLRVEALSLAHQGQRVLTDISFTVTSGERLGLIGENGSGKSTLLRAAAGLMVPDRGTIEATGGAAGHTATVGLLHQVAPFAATATIDDALETAVVAARQAVAEVDRAAIALADAPFAGAAADAYASALDNAERLEAWSIDARVSSMLAGLGLGGIDRRRRTDTLSGGQLARLSLAWLLLRAPDVLLLDEPTNHLDADATEHLRHMLADWRGPVLFASHDRAFLDSAATGLIDLDPAPLPQQLAEERTAPGAGSGVGVTKFTGSYSAYLESRARTRARWERQFRDEQLELQKLRAGVGESHQVGHAGWKPRTETRAAQKFYADRNARVVARRVNDARARLDELTKRQLRAPIAELRFAGFGTAARATVLSGDEPLLTLEHAAVAGRLEPVSFELHAGEKLLVTGPNGVGKSTLLHVVAGDLPTTSGVRTLASGLSVGVLTQQVHVADPCGRGDVLTAEQAYRDAVGEARAEAYPLSASGLLHASDHLRPIAALSLGQQRRLALAILLATPPDILLLDEPSNHLSLLLTEQLEAALSAYQGSVIVASHDRWLQRRWEGIRLHIAPIAHRERHTGGACSKIVPLVPIESTG